MANEVSIAFGKQSDFLGVNMKFFFCYFIIWSMNENIKRAETTTIQCKIKKFYRSQDVVPFFFTLNFVSSVTWLECNPHLQRDCYRSVPIVPYWYIHKWKERHIGRAGLWATETGQGTSWILPKESAKVYGSDGNAGGNLVLNYPYSLKKILDILFEINNDAKNLSMFSKPRVTKKQEVQRSDAKMTVYIAISSRQKVKILTRNVAESLHWYWSCTSE